MNDLQLTAEDLDMFKTAWRETMLLGLGHLPLTVEELARFNAARQTVGALMEKYDDPELYKFGPYLMDLDKDET